jgi:hypothetical protein
MNRDEDSEFGLKIHRVGQNILSINRRPRGLVRGVGERQPSETVLRRLGQPSSPGESPPIRHLLTLGILTLPLVRQI